ncbi:MAG: nicotinate-nucleotide diphosphorylase [Pirellulaceae bacterium]|nr:nicotinate-nucleotide diphosphorylase [Pirellulaceae bacterium]
MMRDYHQQERDAILRDSVEQLTRLAIREDLGRGFDITTLAIVPEELPATADIIARVRGVAAGIELIPWIVECLQATVTVEIRVRDGEEFKPGQCLATLGGNARDVLTCERTILNFLGRLCGIASWTAEHVALVADLPVRIYDTRKTTPGWRHLEKYAVRCGGGHNHRGSLNEAILIKDNHLACYERARGTVLLPSEAVTLAREFLKTAPAPSRSTGGTVDEEPIIEVEVDSLDGLKDALTVLPDIVLLDNMQPDCLREAVQIRNEKAPAVELEASGGVNQKTLRSIALTGVERISLGALTHSAVNLDLGLDWRLAQSEEQ